MQRVLFLLDSTILPKEDIQLNTRVFHWPKGRHIFIEFIGLELGDLYVDFIGPHVENLT